jgi:CHASE1-domain containing sensor protein
MRRLRRTSLRTDAGTRSFCGTASLEEIAEIAAEIENGSYEKKKTEAQLPMEPESPVKAILADIRPLDAIVGNISNGIDSGLSKIRKKADREALKAALRPVIDKLEVLYEKL